MYAERYMNGLGSIPSSSIYEEEYNPFNDSMDFEPITSVVFEEYVNYCNMMESVADGDKSIMEQTAQVLYEISLKDIWDTIKKWVKKGLNFLIGIGRKIKNFFSKKKMDKLSKDLKDAEEEVKRSEEVVIQPSGPALPDGSFNSDRVVDMAFKKDMKEKYPKKYGEAPTQQQSNSNNTGTNTTTTKKEEKPSTQTPSSNSYTASSSTDTPKQEEKVVHVLSPSIKKQLDNIANSCKNQKKNPYPDIINYLNKNCKQVNLRTKRLIGAYYDLRLYFISSYNSYGSGTTCFSTYDGGSIFEDLELAEDDYNNGRTSKSKSSSFRYMYGKRNIIESLICPEVIGKDFVNDSRLDARESVKVTDILKPFDSHLIDKKLRDKSFKSLETAQSDIKLETKEDFIKFYRFCQQGLKQIKTNITLGENLLPKLEKNLKKFETEFDKLVNKSTDISQNPDIMKYASQAFNVTQAIFAWNRSYLQFILKKNYTCLKVMEKLVVKSGKKVA